VRAAHKQDELFTETPRRDAAAGQRALAQLRAEFGDRAVLGARLRDGHLPEASFAWEALHKLRPARPRRISYPPLVRRILHRPPVIAHGLPRKPEASLHALLDDGVLIAEPRGPYIVSGGWWGREIHREYYFVQTRRGRLLWIYFDRRRGKWFQQGAVE